MPTDIRQLTKAGEHFYPQTHIAGLVGYGENGKAIDDEPTAGSENLVKSSGVQKEFALGAVYDISAKNPTAGPNSDGKWESLSALLSDANLNTLIPTSVRKGGMSIKYVQSSDNKYVQYRLMSDTFNTIVANWRGENTFVRTYHDISVSNYETYLPTLKLSDLPKNTVSYISNDISDNVLDIPATNSSQWLIETISGYSNTEYALLQKAYCVVNGRTYVRYGNTDSTYGNWKFDENVHTYHDINATNYTSYLPSKRLSDLPKNSISYISNDVSDDILDIPETNSSQWIVESISGYSNNNIAVLQKAYCAANGRTYTRWSANGTSFTDWSFIDVSNLPKYNIVKTYHDISATNYSVFLPSLKLSDLPKNAISYISNDVSDNVLDIPLTNHSQWLIESISGYFSTNYAIVQRAYCVVNGRTYTRWSANGVSFGDWKSNENTSPLPLYDLSAFKKVGACGDSFTRGSMYKNGPWAGYRTDLAWHHVLARNHGFECHAFAAGGMHARSFLTDSHCLPKLLNTERLELYFLFLGINDAILYGNDSSYLGTIEDIHIGNPSQNADTFYGNYGKIIEKIQEYAPASLQIMMTVKFTPANETNIQIINTAIKAIAALYELPCIDLYNTPVYSTDMYIHSLYGGHPTPILHSAIAKQIDNSFYDCVLDNTPYFNSYSTRCLSNGTFAERPTADVTIAGYVYWDSTNECLWECNGVGANVDWIKIFEVKKDGDTANRPSNAAVGTCYYDKTIGKPIWWNGSNWIDANGTIV